MNGRGPISETDRDAILAYYANQGTPGVNMSQAPAPPVPPPASLPPAGPPAPASSTPPDQLSEAVKYFSLTQPAPAAAPAPSTGLPAELQGTLESTLGKPTTPIQPGGLPEYTGGPILGVGAAAPTSKANEQNAAAVAGAQPKQPSQADLDKLTVDAAKGGSAVKMKPTTVSGGTARSAGGGGYVGDGGAARRELYGTFPAEKHAMQSLADAEMARSDAMAAGMAVIGADRVREAALQEARAASEREIMRAYQEDTQRQLDEVRSQTVDPNRLYQDGGSKALAIIGGMLGGLYMGMNKLSSNPFIDQMNRNIDRDIAIQERQLDRNTKAVGERRGIVADMRLAYHDEDLARTQAKNLYYEGIKQQLQAQASQYDSPAIQARADQGINLVDRQQAALKLDEQAKRAAAAAAAAAFARAEKQREFDNAIKQEEAITHRITSLKSGAGHKEGQSPRERFVGVSRDENGNPVGYLARSSVEAGKATQQLAASRELIALAEKAKAIRADQGMLGRTINRNDPDQFLQLYTPEWQTQIRSLEAQLTGAIKKSEELGALDNGVERFAKPLSGNLDARGSSADDRLNALIEATKIKMQTHNDQLAGQRAVMLPGEEVVQVGQANAPLNLKGSTGVNREP